MCRPCAHHVPTLCPPAVQVLVLVVLVANRVGPAMLIIIVAVTAVSWLSGLSNHPEEVAQTPSLNGTFANIDFEGWQRETWVGLVTFVSIPSLPLFWGSSPLSVLAHNVYHRSPFFFQMVPKLVIGDVFCLPAHSGAGLEPGIHKVELHLFHACVDLHGLGHSAGIHPRANESAGASAPRVHETRCGGAAGRCVARVGHYRRGQRPCGPHGVRATRCKSSQ